MEPSPVPVLEDANRTPDATRLVTDRLLWLFPLVVWTVLAGGSLAWNLSQSERYTEKLAVDRGRFIFQMVESIRLWNARHGGVYVPVTQETRPNPYLEVPERDIPTPSGKALTLVNPAFMTRQLTDIVRENNGIRVHITSLKPINPGNQADPWESRALRSFEDGAAEAADFGKTEEGSAFRYMAPLFTKPACLKCHAKQGYEEGDVRGGISVYLPAMPFLALQREQDGRMAAIHGAVWLLLCGLTLAFLSRLRHQVLALQDAKRKQEDVVQERTAELASEIRERRQAVDRLLMLIEASGEGIFGIDRKGNCTLVNPAALRLLGYETPEALVGRGLRDLIHHSEPDGSPRTERDCKFAAAYRDGIPADGEDEIFWRADGIPITVEYHARPLFEGEDIVGAVVTFSDITQRRKAAEALREKTEALERSNADLQEFAYVASHDLTEPLRMVTSYLQLLERSYEGGLDARGREFLHFAVDGAQRMDRLIHDLLDYSRVTTHGRPPMPTNLTVIFEGVRKILSVAIAESGAEITVESLPTVMGDETQLTRLLQNLVGNAIKYMPPDRIPDIRIRSKRLGGQWSISVADNGIGIDEKHLDRIFGIFQRLHGREEFEGTGIGLAICKKIVERHGGEITVTSVPGEGSTFTFTLAAADE